MIFRGQIIRQGRQWVATVPLLHMAVAGEPRAAKANVMRKIQPCLRDWTGDDGFRCRTRPGDGDDFYLETEHIHAFLPLVLKRSRQKARLSMAEVTARLGYSSRNSYAQYEAGRTKLTFAKFTEIMTVLEPDFEVALDRVCKSGITEAR